MAQLLFSFYGICPILSELTRAGLLNLRDRLISHALFISLRNPGHVITVHGATDSVQPAYRTLRHIEVAGGLLLAGARGLVHAAEGHLNAAGLVHVMDG
jgi:hypothetical protein